MSKCPPLSLFPSPLQGKRVVSERTERRPGPADIRGPADDGQAKRVESTARGKQPPHTAKRDEAAQV